MQVFHVNDVVCLKGDLPELNLHCGEIGVIQSTWFSPTEFYEVEFRPRAQYSAIRTLVAEQQLRQANSPERPN
jgi:hypothetical protein